MPDVPLIDYELEDFRQELIVLLRKAVVKAGLDTDDVAQIAEIVINEDDSWTEEE